MADQRVADVDRRPAGLDRNNGTRTDPHSAPAQARTPAPAPPRQPMSATTTAPRRPAVPPRPRRPPDATPSMPNRRTTRIADPLDANTPDASTTDGAGHVEERRDPTRPRQRRSTTRHGDRQERDSPTPRATSAAVSQQSSRVDADQPWSRNGRGAPRRQPVLSRRLRRRCVGAVTRPRRVPSQALRFRNRLEGAAGWAIGRTAPRASMRQRRAAHSRRSRRCR